MPYERSRVASRSMRTSRVARPLMSTRATPSTRCSRLLTTLSPRIDSSRALRVLLSSAITTAGWALSLSKRAIVGVFASFGNSDWIAPMRSRRSCMARPRLAFKLNSTWLWLRPSKLREVMRLTPAMLFSASSTSLVTSRSTASGDAIRWPTASRSVVCTSCTASGGRPASTSAACTSCHSARFEWIASEPPRRMQALPLLIASDAASIVTFGRLS